LVRMRVDRFLEGLAQQVVAALSVVMRQ
jgi:hypothetical protein